MASNSKPPRPLRDYHQEELESVKASLNQIVNKLSHARVLNGGFDKLEKEIQEIKSTQVTLSLESNAQKQSSQRVEAKLDKIFDPETGLYSKFIKNEAMLESLNSKINSLVSIDKKIENQLNNVEKKTLDNSHHLIKIQKVTGEDNEQLRKSIDISKAIWWLLAMGITGIVGGVGKLIWDFFI